MIHESAMWSNTHNRWFFLPRRCSTEVYNEKIDEHMGCSVLISTDPDGYDVQMIRVSYYYYFLPSYHTYKTFRLQIQKQHVVFHHLNLCLQLMIV